VKLGSCRNNNLLRWDCGLLVLTGPDAFMPLQQSSYAPQSYKKATAYLQAGFSVFRLIADHQNIYRRTNFERVLCYSAANMRLIYVAPLQDIELEYGLLAVRRSSDPPSFRI
jgi:hypothetical protein